MKIANITELSCQWDEIVLICKKCSKRLDGGFGPNGKTRLDKALRKQLGVAKGRKARIGFVMTPCFDLCPKDGVSVACGSRPGTIYIVPKGAGTAEIAEALGLEAQAAVITWPFGSVSSGQ